MKKVFISVLIVLSFLAISIATNAQQCIHLGRTVDEKDYSCYLVNSRGSVVIVRLYSVPNCPVNDDDDSVEVEINCQEGLVRQLDGNFFAAQPIGDWDSIPPNSPIGKARQIYCR